MQNSARGFTFVEILIVTALASVVFLFSQAIDTRAIARKHVRTERDVLVSLVLARTRSHALTNVHETAHGIRIENENHQYILYEGTTYIPGSDTNQIVKFTTPHISVTHSEATRDVVFAPLSGNILLGTGTLTITQGQEALTIGLNAGGRIDW